MVSFCESRFRKRTKTIVCFVKTALYMSRETSMRNSISLKKIKKLRDLEQNVLHSRIKLPAMVSKLQQNKKGNYYFEYKKVFFSVFRVSLYYGKLSGKNGDEFLSGFRRSLTNFDRFPHLKKIMNLFLQHLRLKSWTYCEGLSAWSSKLHFLSTHEMLDESLFRGPLTF